MAGGREGDRPRAPRRDGVLLALLAFLLFAALAQHTFYGPDGRIILKMTMSGMVAHPLHLLYVPMLRASYAVVSLWGGSWFVAGTLLSQVGAALGVFFWHRACARLGLARGQAALVVALCATAPAVLFFASVVELHAPFLAFAGLSCYLAARLVTHATFTHAMCLGLSTGLAFGAHATGHLLMVWLPLLVLVEAPHLRLRRWLWLGVLAAAVHVAVTLGLVPLMRALGAEVHASAAARHLVGSNQGRLNVTSLLMQVWNDGLRPFAPMSFVVWVGVHRRWRLGLVFLLGCLTYGAVTFTLMAPGSESGAYLVPLVWPAALLIARTLPKSIGWLVVLGGLGLGVRWIARHDDTHFGRAFAADVRAVAQRGPVDLICGQHVEFDACMIFGPEIEWRELINETNLPPETVPVLVQHLHGWLMAQEAAGRQIILTEGAMQYLAAPVGSEQRTGPLLRQAIEAEFVLEPVHGAVLRAWRLRPR